MYRTARLALLSLLTFTAPTWAQTNDNNWFEIEVLVFERGAQQPLQEQFNGPVSVPQVGNSLDLISSLYYKDLTAVVNAMCGTSSAQWQTTQLDTALDFTAAPLAVDSVSDDFWSEYFALESAKFMQSDKQPSAAVCPLAADPEHPLLAPRLMTEPPRVLPITPAGAATHSTQTYLADTSAQKLQDLAYQLRTRGGHQLLLHTVIRSPLQTKRQSNAWRLVAGERLSPEWDSQGMPTLQTSVQTAALESSIDRTYQYLQAGGDLTRLNQANLVLDQVWQLDGTMLVYNERILSAELQLLLRKKNQPGQALSLYRLNKSTRLLLEDIHYIDHPKFGVILQIRRFTPPLLATEMTETAL